ncbi:tRNA-dihydrouridine synthase [Haladaptatus pallidirubidus]|uniref:tRNA-dihydrouridine synthase n=1 Tax=Haladaptatus pallidirubidus TaxID=1008152 RepID=A0AAV3UC15_9EURY|nr:tRNA-dihydrouridine synthase [Haladaptatus pallidirubidus]
MFSPRVALASLSGKSDAEWATDGAEYAGAAFLGGIALDEQTRTAARKLVSRDRTEFLPDDPIEFLDEQLAALSNAEIRAGFNVRSATLPPIRDAAEVCRKHDAIIELNAHCRQEEMCATGAGQSLLRHPDRLCEQVRVAKETGATVGVKVRTEVFGVDLPNLVRRVTDMGAAVIHVDTMDSERVIADIADATDCFLVANNGVRNEETVFEYLDYGADAVSVGRPSDRPEVLSQVRHATDEWFAEVVA